MYEQKLQIFLSHVWPQTPNTYDYDLYNSWVEQPEHHCHRIKSLYSYMTALLGCSCPPYRKPTAPQ